METLARSPPPSSAGCGFISFDPLSIESLAISPSPEKPHVRDLNEPPSPRDPSSPSFPASSASDVDKDVHQVRKSPFHVYYMREDDAPCLACARRRERASVSADSNLLESSDSGGSASLCCPHTGFSWSKRETRLYEGWEEKRSLFLREELSKMEDRARPGLLGRSASCDIPTSDVSHVRNLENLYRSASDCALAHQSKVCAMRTRSLTNHDFEELQGCIDLGFRFDESFIPSLGDTLPALEVFCAVAKSLQGAPSPESSISSATGSPTESATPSPSSSWAIANPGDNPESVKERLKYWAQAVVCKARIGYYQAPSEGARHVPSLSSSTL